MQERQLGLSGEARLRPRDPCSGLRSKLRAFSLIELMVVVAIVGILAAIAVPNFAKFQCRAKQGEAKTILKAVYVMQVAYHGEHENYASAPGQGDVLIDAAAVGRRRYNFTVVGGASTFTATGVGTADVNTDTWVIDQQAELRNTVRICD